jgi:uncharacterized damage-inducible protein DinB
MYRKTEDFLTEWDHESKSTLRILDALSEASLTQMIVPGGRNIGQLAWHLALTLGEMLGKAGLTMSGPAEDAPVPTGLSVIREAYRSGADAVAEQVRRSWPDAMLPGTVSMYGEEWRRGDVLSALIAHQAHHRGQMTVLMRQAGLRVPGIYGPSKEEWAAMNMPAPW